MNDDDFANSQFNQTHFSTPISPQSTPIPLLILISQFHFGVEIFPRGSFTSLSQKERQRKKNMHGEPLKTFIITFQLSSVPLGCPIICKLNCELA
jgi:hypothetical protein